MPDFDERLIEACHVSAAIRRYLKEKPSHRPARSAFLLYRRGKLPAKMLLRLAFEEATGVLPKPETLTGGGASVKLLRKLGFQAVYEKPERASGNRNRVKDRRRAALKAILERNFGPVQTEWKCAEIVVPDLENRGDMDKDIRRVLQAVESYRGISVKGRKNHKLAFDLFVTALKLPIEYDERQHFTPPRAAALRRYPGNVELGFDPKRWIHLSEEIRAGDNSPIYRDEQRAFYDAIRDLMAPKVGLAPVMRIFEEDVEWEREAENPDAVAAILRQIDSLVRRRR